MKQQAFIADNFKTTDELYAEAAPTAPAKRQGMGRILTCSHLWCAKEHPDPTGIQKHVDELDARTLPETAVIVYDYTRLY